MEALAPRVLYSADPLGLSGDMAASEYNTEFAEVLGEVPGTSTIDNPQLRTHVVIVDTSVPDHHQIIKSLVASPDDQTEFVIYTISSKDSIDQVTDYLTDHSNLAAIHFITHGSDSSIQLGSSVLNNQSLPDHQDDLDIWKDTLSVDGDLLFYGCNLASDEQGKTLVTQIAIATQADVAASDNLTGHESLNADWQLEFVVGSVEENDALFANYLQHWKSVLAAITVTTHIDTIDAAEADLASLVSLEANPGPDEKVSLREALIAANADPDPDVIYLPAETYEISTQTDSLENFYISSPIKIIGDGDQTIIDGNNTHRVFSIVEAETVTLEQLTITHGKATDAGGGIYVRDTNLELNDVSIKENEATHGGGIFVDWGVIANLRNVDLWNNVARQDGGGIYSNDSTITTYKTVLKGNTATNGATEPGGGGGIYSNGTLNTYATTFQNNNAQHGGGLYINAVLNSEDTYFEKNTATYEGGAIFQSVTGDGKLKRSLIEDNTAEDGAGIINYGSLSITDSTLTENRAGNYGGAIKSITGAVSISRSTIADNRGDIEGGALWIDQAANSNIDIQGSIIARNRDGSDIHSSVVSKGFNLTDTTFTSPHVSDQTNITNAGDLGLDTILQDNGGATVRYVDATFTETEIKLKTYALLQNSKAINSGELVGIGNLHHTITDATGAARNGTSDIGAFEYRHTTPQIELYWGDRTLDSIHRFNVTTGLQQEIIDTNIYPLADPIDGYDPKNDLPIDIEIDTKNGYLYWLANDSYTNSNGFDGSLNGAFLPEVNGSTTQNLSSDFKQPFGLAIDSDNNRLFITENRTPDNAPNKNEIMEYDRDGNFIKTIVADGPTDATSNPPQAPLASVTDLEYDSVNDRIYWTDTGFSDNVSPSGYSDMGVHHVDADGNVSTVSNITGLRPYMLSLGPNESVYWINGDEVFHTAADGTLIKRTGAPNNPDSTHVFNNPIAVEYVAANDKVYIIQGTPGVLWELSSDLSSASVVSNQLNNPVTLAAATIEPVTNGPSVINNNGLALGEDDNQRIDITTLASVDPDTAPENLEYTVVAPFPINGELIRNGTQLTTADNTFTQADIDAGHLHYQHLGIPGTEEIYFTVSDGTFTTEVKTFNITAASINDAPVIDISADLFLQPISEDDYNSAGDSVSQLMQSSPGDWITDIDAGAVESIAVIKADDSNGVWEFKTNPAIADWTPIQSTINPVYDGNALLLEPDSLIRFVPNQDFNGPAGAIEFRAHDRTAGHVTGTYINITPADIGGSAANSAEVESATISVTAVNDAPVLSSIEAGLASYTEDGTGTAITGTLGITDIDNTEIQSAVVSITAGFVSGEDVLSYVDQNGITGTYIQSIGVLTLSGAASLVNYEAAIHSIEYVNTSNNPSTTSRTVQIMVSDGGNDSNALQREIEVIATNDRPIVDLDTDDSAATGLSFTNTFIEGGLPVNIADSDASITDPDHPTLTKLEATISNIMNPGTETLTVSVPNNSWIQTYDSVNGTLAIEAPLGSTHAQWLDVIKSIQYSNTSSLPDPTNRIITIEVSDGVDSNLPLAKSTIGIAAVNNTPVLASIEPVAVSYTENGNPVPLSSTLTLTDSDDTIIESASVSINSNYVPVEDELQFSNQNNISGAFDQLTGTMLLTGSASVLDYQTALQSITYLNTSEQPSTQIRGLTFVANDGDSDSNSVSRNIEVIAVNDAPALSTIEAEAATHTENDTGTGITGNLSVVDPDSTIQSAIVSISSNYVASEDALTLTDTSNTNITAGFSNGILTLTGTATSAEYQSAIRSIHYINSSENPSTLTRTINIVLNDGSLNSNQLSREMQVIPVNDAPLAVDSNVTTTEDTPYTFALSDFGFDDPAEGHTLQSVYVDTSHPNVSVDPTNQDIIYTPTPDSTATDSFDFFVTDNGDISNNGFETSQTPATMSINITAVNDAPQLSTIELAPANFTENSAGTGITGNLSIVDPDSTIQSAVVSISSNFTASEDALALTDTSITNITTSFANGTLTLSGTATPAEYQTAIRSIHYINSSENPTDLTRTVSIVVNDGQLDSNILTRDVNIVPVNDAPAITDAILPFIIEDPIQSTLTGQSVNQLFAANFSDIDTGDTLAGIAVSAVNITGTSATGEWQYQIASNGWTPIGSVSAANALILDTAAQLRFVPTNNAFGNAPSLTVHAIDSAYTKPFTDTTSRISDALQAVGGVTSFSNAAILTNEITADNDAPFIADATLPSISEDPILSTLTGQTVNQLFSTNFSDIDTGDTLAGIALSTENVTGTSATGEWQYQIASNGWNAIGTVSAANALILDTATQLRFVPDPNAFGFAPTLSAHAIDSTYIGNFTDATTRASDDVQTVGGITSFSTSVIITNEITPENDAPVLATIEAAPLQLIENSLPNVITGNLSISDLDDINLNSATLSIVGFDGAVDIVGIDNAQVFSSFITPVIDNTNGVVTLTGNATSADYQAAIRAITYQNTSDSPSANLNRTVEIVVNDGQLDSNILTRDINIVPVNDAPAITDAILPSIIEDPILSTLTGQTVDQLFSPSFSDVDAGDTLAGIALSAENVTDTSATGEWQYQIASNGWNPIGAVSTANALVLDAATQIRFVPDANSFGTAPGLSVHAIDSTYIDNFTDSTTRASADVQTVGGITSFSTSVIITNEITPDNDAPVLATIEAAPLLFVENSPPNGITGNLSISDLDDTNLNSATVSIIGFDGTVDIIDIDSTQLIGSFITSVIDNTNGVITLTGNATLADYQAAIRAITYQNTSDNPSANPDRTVEIVVNDDQLDSNILTREINIVPVNDAPAVTDAILPSIIEDPTLSTLTGQTVDQLFSASFSDVDTGDSLAGIAISAVNVNATSATGEWQYQIASNAWTAIGSVSSANALILDTATQLRFDPTANSFGSAPTLTVHAIDSAYNKSFTDAISPITDDIQNVGGITSFSAAVIISNDIAPDNDAPVLSTIEAPPLQFVENSLPIAVTGSLSILDLDNATLNSATISLIGFDAAADRMGIDNNQAINTLITPAIDNVNGAITLTGNATAADYQAAMHAITYQNISDSPTASQSKTVQFVVNDAQLDSNILTRDINVVPVNDAPTITDTTLPAIVEDPILSTLTGQAVNQLFTANFSDVDTGDILTGIAISSVNVSDTSATGDWQYQIASNGWKTFGTVSATNALILDGSTQLRFVPGANAFGAAPTLTVHAIDSSYNKPFTDATAPVTDDLQAVGGTTPFSKNTLLGVSITAVNDIPVIADATLPSQLEDASTTNPISIIDLFAAQYSDADGAPEIFGVAITSNPTNPSQGTWQYTHNASDWYNINSVGDANALVLDSGSFVRFLPTANYHGNPDDLSIRAIDGIYSGAVTTSNASRETIDVSDNQTLLSAEHAISISITPVNDAPSGTNSTVVTLEDTPYAFAIGDFGFSDPFEAHTFKGLIVKSLPSSGVLSNSDTAITIGEFVGAQDIVSGNLLFTPAENHNGNAAISWDFAVLDNGGTENGGRDQSYSSNTINVNIIPVNDAPQGSNGFVSSIEGVPATVSLSDLGFSDYTDNDELDAIIIESTPLSGDLLLNGTPVILGQQISATDISVGMLTFTAQVTSTTDQARFDFRVVDNGGTADGGQNTAAQVNTLEFGILPPPNTPPIASDNTIDVREDTAYQFSFADFGFSDPSDGHGLLSVTIIDTPVNGNLSIDNALIAAGNTIVATDIHKLTFTPAASEHGPAYSALQYKVTDNGTLAGGGSNTSDFPNTIGFNVLAVNDAPIGFDATVTTNQVTPYAFTSADFTLSDPDDGHELAEILIEGLPSTGTLTLNQIPVALGDRISASNIASSQLLFTPEPLANVNQDSFQFRVVDNGGGVNGGTDTSQTINAITINIGADNNRPSGTDNILVVNEDGRLPLTPAVFGFKDLIDNHSMAGIVVSAVPENGFLLLNGAPVQINQFVTHDELSNERLAFTPELNQHAISYASIEFLVLDNGSVQTGKHVAAAPSTLSFTVVPVNDAPRDLSLTGALQVTENTETESLGIAHFSDPDENDSHRFSVNDSRFEMVDARLSLKPGVTIDFESEPTIALKITVEDESDAIATHDFILQVTDVNEQPIVDQGIAPESGIAPFSFTLPTDTFFDTDGDPLDLSATLPDGSPLPAGLQFNATDGSFTVLDSNGITGVTSVLVSAIDPGGLAVSTQFDITIEVPFESALPSYSDPAPVIPPIPTPEENTEESDESQVVTSGGPVSEGEAEQIDEQFEVSERPFAQVRDNQTQRLAEVVQIESTYTVVAPVIYQSEYKNYIAKTESTYNLLDSAQIKAENMRQQIAYTTMSLNNLAKQADQNHATIGDSEVLATKVLATSVTLTSSFSVGYILWLLRGGTLLASVMASLPAWRSIDPLPILDSLTPGDEDDTETLESMVEDTGKQPVSDHSMESKGTAAD